MIRGIPIFFQVRKDNVYAKGFVGHLETILGNIDGVVKVVRFELLIDIRFESSDQLSPLWVRFESSDQLSLRCAARKDWSDDLRKLPNS